RWYRCGADARRGRPLPSIGAMRTTIATDRLLLALAQLDDPSGSTLDQIAWELDVEPDRILTGLASAVREGLLVGHTPATVNGEARWRLTPGGWTRLRAAGFHP